MNIDERCYGYEPAASQLRDLRRALAEAEALLREAREWHIPLNSINDRTNLAARIDAFLEKKP